MTVIVTAGRKQAQKLLHEVGNQFISGFMATNMNAVVLRSKEPGICWKAGGIVSFLAISEFSGPNSMENNAPLLFRIRVNFRPPPALTYHLGSPAVRHKLGLHLNPLIADDPPLELTALPEEIGVFGAWIVSWLDSQFNQRKNPPSPPIPLIAWGWDAQGNDQRLDLMTIGQKWRDYEYLWTPHAITTFEPWLHKS